MGAVIAIPIDDLINLDRYPLDRSGSESRLVAVAEARSSLARDGCAVVTNLVRPAAVTAINTEIERQRHSTHFSTQTMNP